MTLEELLAYKKKAYIARIGNMCLVSPMTEKAYELKSMNEIEEVLKKFPQEMINCLKDAPNVISYSEDMDPELCGCFMINEKERDQEVSRVTGLKIVNGVVPDFFDCVNFQVMWPLKNQKFASYRTKEVV